MFPTHGDLAKLASRITDIESNAVSHRLIDDLWANLNRVANNLTGTQAIVGNHPFPDHDGAEHPTTLIERADITNQRLDALEEAAATRGASDLEAIARLGARMDALEASCATREATADLSTNGINDVALRARLADHETRLSRTDERFAAHDARITNLNEALGRYRDEAVQRGGDTRIDELAAKIENTGLWLDQTVKRLGDQLRIIDHRVDGLEDRVEGLSQLLEPGPPLPVGYHAVTVVEPVTEPATPETMATFGQLVALCEDLVISYPDGRLGNAVNKIHQFLLTKGLP